MPGGMVEEELRRAARAVTVSDGNGGGNTAYSQPAPLDRGRPKSSSYGESYGHAAGSSSAGYSNGVMEHEVRLIEYEPDLAPGDPADLEGSSLSRGMMLAIALLVISELSCPPKPPIACAS